MFKKLVVGLDGSTQSARALAWALSVTGPESSIVGVHGFSPGRELLLNAVQIDFDPIREATKAKLTEEWLKPATLADVDASAVFMDESPATALLKVGETADAVVVGNHGQTRWSEHHLGEIPSQLIHRSRGPVVLINEKAALPTTPDQLVVGVDSFELDHHPCLDWAFTVADAFGAKVHLIHVNVPLPYIGDIEGAERAARATGAAEAMADLVDRLNEDHPDIKITGETRTGHLLEELSHASEDSSLLVIGSHHSRLLGATILGAAARHIPTTAHCPVAVIPGRRE